VKTQEGQDVAKAEFEKAKVALEISTQQMIMRLINRSSLAPGPRRPVGSSPNFRIPAETANSGTGQSCAQGSYGFDAKSAKLVKRPDQGKGCASNKEFEPDIQKIAIEIWDRITVQLHEDAFKAYVDAFITYEGYTAEVMGAIAAEAMHQAEQATRAGAEGLSEEFQRYAHSLALERCQAAHSAYLSHKSHETMMQLIITAIEAQLMGADSDPIVQRNLEIVDTLKMEATTTVP
jgi:hypothetical protein